MAYGQDYKRIRVGVDTTEGLDIEKANSYIARYDKVMKTLLESGEALASSVRLIGNRIVKDYYVKNDHKEIVNKGFASTQKNIRQLENPHAYESAIIGNTSFKNLGDVRMDTFSKDVHGNPAMLKAYKAFLAKNGGSMEKNQDTGMYDFTVPRIATKREGLMAETLKDSLSRNIDKDNRFVQQKSRAQGEEKQAILEAKDDVRRQEKHDKEQERKQTYQEKKQGQQEIKENKNLVQEAKYFGYEPNTDEEKERFDKALKERAANGTLAEKKFARGKMSGGDGRGGDGGGGSGENSEEKSGSFGIIALMSKIGVAVMLLRLIYGAIKTLAENAFKAAETAHKSVKEGLTVGLSASEVIQYNLGDKAAGLEEGTTVKAIQGTVKKFHDANLSDKDITTLALIVGEDVKDQILNAVSKGDADPEEMTNNVLAGLMAKSLAGQNIYGTQVGVPQAIRNNVAVAAGYDPALAEILLAKLKDVLNQAQPEGVRKAAEEGTVADWHAAKMGSSNVSGLTPEKSVMMSQTIESLNSLKAIFDAVLLSVFSDMAVNIKGILDLLTDMLIRFLPKDVQREIYATYKAQSLSGAEEARKLQETGIKEYDKKAKEAEALGVNRADYRTAVLSVISGSGVPKNMAGNEAVSNIILDGAKAKVLMDVAETKKDMLLDNAKKARPKKLVETEATIMYDVREKLEDIYSGKNPATDSAHLSSAIDRARHEAAVLAYPDVETDAQHTGKNIHTAQAIAGGLLPSKGILAPEEAKRFTSAETLYLANATNQILKTANPKAVAAAEQIVTVRVTDGATQYIVVKDEKGNELGRTEYQLNMQAANDVNKAVVESQNRSASSTIPVKLDGKGNVRGA